MAEAFTMKRTIATKMIVMSNELRTRGNMPGAIRSEIITRSPAWEAITTSRVDAIAAIVALRAGAAQEQRHTVADAAGFARRVRYGNGSKSIAGKSSWPSAARPDFP